MKKIILYIILGSSLIANSYFVYETTYLKKHIQYIEQENENLKETPEIYWQNAIEKFNNKNYKETKEILNKLIEKFPTSSLVKISQDKIKEIDLIEKKKKEEEQRIIKSLPKQIANAKNAFYAERILNDLDSKYDESYSELKDVIKKERDNVREKEAKKIIQSLPKQVKNSKSALEAEKMLEDIRTKYGSYPGVQQAIGEEKAKIREKIEKEKEEQKENKLGGGYKKLKWGMSKRQIEQTLSTKVRHNGGGVYSVYLKADGKSVDCEFYNDKLYSIYISMINLKMSGENNIDIVYKKVLHEFSKKFNEDGISYEKNNYGLKSQCHFWEDKYTKITVTCCKNGYTNTGSIEILYESKNIINQMEKDRVREQEERQKKYNKSIDNQINNL